MVTLLTIAGAIAIIAANKRKQKKQSIGAVAFYGAINDAQRYGVPFGHSYKTQDLSARQKQYICDLGHEYGYKQTKKSIEAGKTYEDSVYTYLNNKYKQVAGIGTTLKPYKIYKIFNEDGNLVLEHHHYDKKADFEQAVFDAENWGRGNEETFAYWQTLLYIACGGKFSWDSKYVDTNKVAYGLRDELFGSRNGRAEAAARTAGKKIKESRPQEKKAYSKIIKKDGAYPVLFAESLASDFLGESYNTQTADTNSLRDGVLRALSEVNTPQQARDIILDEWYDIYNNEHGGNFEEDYQYQQDIDDADMDDIMRQRYGL